MCSNFYHLFLTVQVLWVIENYLKIIRHIQPLIGAWIRPCSLRNVARHLVVFVDKLGLLVRIEKLKKKVEATIMQKDLFKLVKYFYFVFVNTYHLLYSLHKLKQKLKLYVGVNENLKTFLYTLNRGNKNFFLEGEKSFLVSLIKVYNKVEMSTTKQFVFQFLYLVSVYPLNI